jgi:hypothetical protein
MDIAGYRDRNGIMTRLERWVSARDERTERGADRLARAALAWHRPRAGIRPRRNSSDEMRAAYTGLEPTWDGRGAARGGAAAAAAADSSDDDSSDDDSSDDEAPAIARPAPAPAPAITTYFTADIRRGEVQLVVSAAEARRLLEQVIDLTIRANPALFAGASEANIHIRIPQVLASAPSAEVAAGLARLPAPPAPAPRAEDEDPL